MKWFVVGIVFLVAIFLAGCVSQPVGYEKISGAAYAGKAGYTTCIDSDEGSDDVEDRDTLTYTRGNIRATVTDVCVGNYRVEEYYCNDYDVPKGHQKRCDKGTICKVGKCAPE